MGSWRRGRGGLIGSPAPGGSGRGPAQLRELLLVLLPSPPLLSRWAGNVLFPPLPPRGQRAGRAGRWPTLFSSSPPRCKPEPPTLLQPLTHAAPGLARCRVWDRVRGWGQPCGERASRRHLAAVPCAGERPWRPLPASRLLSTSTTPAGERRPLAKAGANSFLLGRKEGGLRTCGKGILSPDPCQPGFLLGRGE